MEKRIELKPETLYFVEALQKLLQVEEEVYSGLVETYGEDGGEKRWYKSRLYTFLESAKGELKMLVGDSLELGFSGLLNDPEDKKEEDGVC